MLVKYFKSIWNYYKVIMSLHEQKGEIIMLLIHPYHTQILF